MKQNVVNKKFAKGFTLLELLVVIVIIGILAAIALPQYKEAVEKSIMQEAIMNLRTIASANERFYLINNRYALYNEMDKLDIEIPGEIKGPSQIGLSVPRVMTKYFIYAPNMGAGGARAIAHRVKEGVTDYEHEGPYYLYISSNNNKLYCYSSSSASATQKKLCRKIARDHQL